VAIECRINAEDVEKDFRPTPGKIEAIHIPGGPGVRVDKAVYADYVIPPYYDSMIAKLIVRARTREQALAKMRVSLDQFVIQGVPTTIPFHQEIFEHPDFIAGNYDTSFIETKFRQPKDDSKKKSMTLKRPGETEGAPAPDAAEPVAVTAADTDSN
jgi:acetyl-CoA carboxylase biotin carboxylase subunit